MDNGLLVWMDLEMTGLDPEKERIIEMATLITNANLELVATGPELVIHQPAEILAKMDEWNTHHHKESGLTERVTASTVTETDAEMQTLAFLQAYCAPRAVPLAGSSIHQDRRFLQKYMPKLEEFLHYRNVDVSTIKELVKRWYPAVIASCPPQGNRHRAMEDIQDSINEMRHYRKHAFRAPDQEPPQG